MSDLYIKTRGHGDTHLVLLHGWAMHGAIFEPLCQQLEARCTLHVVDLPGHGHSRDCAVPLEASACARAIVDATPPAAWLGWSMGGLIALTAALDYPDRITGLAMVSSSPCFVRGPDWPHGVEKDVFEQFGTDLDVDYRKTLDRFLALEAMGSSHARDEIRHLRKDVFSFGEPDKRVLKQGLELLDHTDLRPRMPDLTQPSVWIAGGRDRLVPAAGMEWAAGQCGGTHTCIRHAGHAAFLGFTDAVIDALDPWLARCNP
ncbi:pimeloyl-ACP methyl ester esterase BioH [Oleiagrimonas sp.]|jgi:pimeloyl-[acyl-carrier protein] methyl ester esterase|uniref:pimeloyl-ACP methyl ester esterase BioH n=1 Tax=Oleiagrimonas sp. TaxID=2010330 RepID=UPI002624F209|nr:pimeloyl-ACP methyl ester esterase BioH [Oleiagrimonas sp.]MDA3915139.1 pimeloyl-ACP methyl ester esterase BioH [Oleiagrimonas sp.]